MRAILLTGAIVFIQLTAFSQNDSLNMTKLSQWADPTSTDDYNDIWGYVDTAGNEYAIFGNESYTYFMDVTNPTNPVLCDKEVGKDNGAIHRDYKVYQNYAYGVADEGSASLQIFDLSYLPDSVVKVYDSDSFTQKCHNIFIDGKRLYLAGNTLKTGPLHGMDVLSLNNPASPTFIHTLNVPYVHDVYVRDDTAYCSNGSAGLFIYDYTDSLNPTLISSITTYPEQGYNHSSWVTADGNTLVFADETWGMALKVYDISDINNPTYISKFRSNIGAIPHNPFIKNNKVYISYYHDGIQVFDLADSSNVCQTNYYDTYPNNPPGNYNGYQGAWGLFPFLPSGNLLGLDITYGLFVLQETANTTLPQAAMNVGSISGCGPYTVNFDNTTHNACDFYWDFGDGTGTSTDKFPSYTYTSPGMYVVKLYATNGIGTDSITDTVTLDSVPIHNIPYSEDFEDFDAEMCFSTGINAGISIISASDSNSMPTAVMRMAGGGDFNDWLGPDDCAGIFPNNPNHFASAEARVNTLGYSNLYLSFDYKLYMDWDTSLTNFRVLIDGNSIGLCEHPEVNIGLNTWKHIQMDISSYIDADDQLNVSFETVNMLDAFNIENKVYVDNVLITNLSPLTISEEKHSGFTMYPNPTNGEIQLTSEQYISQIQIVDAVGRTVFNESFNHQKRVIINTASNKAGIYFVYLINSDGQKLVQKLHIQN